MINTFAMLTPGPFEWLVILITACFVFVLPILLIVLVIHYVKRGNKERRQLRMVITKLADELDQTRKSQAGKQ